MTCALSHTLSLSLSLWLRGKTKTIINYLSLTAVVYTGIEKEAHDVEERCARPRASGQCINPSLSSLSSLSLSLSFSIFLVSSCRPSSSFPERVVMFTCIEGRGRHETRLFVIILSLPRLLPLRLVPQLAFFAKEKKKKKKSSESCPILRSAAAAAAQPLHETLVERGRGKKAMRANRNRNRRTEKGGSPCLV